MLKSFKTEIHPTEEQKVRIHKTIGTCRFIYNFYLAHNKELYQNGEKFMSSSKFRVWLNHEYLPQHPEYLWIKEAYSKAVTQAVNHGQTAFKKFFNHESAFPKFKKKGRSDVKMYFVKNNPKDCRCERHRVNIPSLGWVRIKEKGYIPTTKEGYIIKSGHVSMKAGRYYVSALIEIPDNIGQLAAVGMIAKVVRKKSPDFALIFAGIGLCFCPVIMILAPHLPLAYRGVAFIVLMTVLNAPQCAVALCTIQILLNAAPEKNRSLLISLFTMITTLTNSVLPLLGVRLYTALGADLTALYRFNLIDLGVRILSTLGLIWRYQKAKKDGFLTKISD